MTDYTATIEIDASPEEAYQAVLDVRGWWNDAVDGPTDIVGEDFRFEVPGIHRSLIRVTELQLGRRVVWRVLENWMAFVADQREWVGSEIRFEIEPAAAGGSTLRFTHEGLTPSEECYELCSNAWGHFIRVSLRRLIETGVGMPGTNPDEAKVREELGIA